ncbi:MAG: tetratricopeptide repeat protein [Phycisphaerae bacterium]|nr:tetratricopeptide repeat protein [Phycisphaerae bacterium]
MVLAVCVLCGGAPAQQEGPSHRLAVAILSLEDRTSDPNDGHWSEGITGLLTRQLRCAKAVRLLSDTAIAYALQESGLERGSAVDASQARVMGETIEAQRVVWGRFQRDKDTWQVSLQVLNVATGTASEELTASGTDWFAMADTLTDKTLAHLQIDPNQAEKAKMRRRFTTSARALEEGIKAFWVQVNSRPQSEQESCLRRAMELDPNSAQICAALGATLLNQGRTAEGERLIRQAIALDPNETNAHAALAFFLVNQGELAGAKEQIKKACELDPDDAAYAAMLARVVGFQRNWDEAAVLAEQASALDPFNAGCHAHLAAVLVRLQQRDKALEQLRLAERTCVSGMAAANTWLVVADTYRVLGEKPKAIDAYRQLLDVGRQIGADPKKVDAYEQTMKALRASLTPTFIQADMPQTFSDEALDKALRERLTDEEMKAVTYPLRFTPQMKAWAEELTKGASTDLDKAKALFDGLTRRVEASEGYQTRAAEEVYAAWQKPAERFWCGDYTVLYVALARSAGLKAFFTRVDNDFNGQVVSHACAAVFADGKVLLVDASSNWFGVPHRRYHVMDDLGVAAYYLMTRTQPDDLGCRLALKVCPSMVRARLAWIEQSDPDTARRELEAMSEPDPNTYDAYMYWLLRAGVALYDNRADLAEAHLRKAISAAPGLFWAHHRLGTLLQAQSRLLDARKEFQWSVGAPVPEIAEDARRRLAQINEQLWAQHNP